MFFGFLPKFIESRGGSKLSDEEVYRDYFIQVIAHNFYYLSLTFSISI